MHVSDASCEKEKYSRNHAFERIVMNLNDQERPWPWAATVERKVLGDDRRGGGRRQSGL